MLLALYHLLAAGIIPDIFIPTICAAALLAPLFATVHWVSRCRPPRRLRPTPADIMLDAVCARQRAIEVLQDARSTWNPRALADSPTSDEAAKSATDRPAPTSIPGPGARRTR
jgi:hypothetical protein